MWTSMMGSSALPAIEQASIFTEKRHALLAGNIANLDTPDYQTRDLSLNDFQSTLKDALESEDSPSMPGSAATLVEPMDRVRDVGKQILYHDGSDVSLEEQVTEVSKNQGLHNMTIALMRSQFQSLQIAIQESVAI